MKITPKILAGMIDSTLLKHDAAESELAALCAHAVDREMRAVCVYPEHMEYVFSRIEPAPVRLDAVAGFPDGNDPTREKQRQAEQRIAAGADEVDMVMNVGWFLGKRYRQAFDDIRGVSDTVHDAEPRRMLTGTPVLKVIIESAVLEDEEKRQRLPFGALIRDAAVIAADAGADFVKTSTGMHAAGGVRDNHVAVIASAVPAGVLVKAAGGVRSWDHVRRLLKEGAARFGTSSAGRILEELCGALEREKREYFEI